MCRLGEDGGAASSAISARSIWKQKLPRRPRLQRMMWLKPRSTRNSNLDETLQVSVPDGLVPSDSRGFVGSNDLSPYVSLFRILLVSRDCVLSLRRLSARERKRAGEGNPGGACRCTRNSRTSHSA